MPLEQVQRFMTAYLRDHRFRQRVREDQRDQAEAEMGLDAADVMLVRKMSLDDLDRAAEGFRDERRSKREAEFRQFTENLACYGSLDTFFEQFDSAYSHGLLGRPLEMDRFLNFSTRFVLEHSLPDYLIDLLRFCYHYVKVSDIPRDRSKPALEEPPSQGLQPSHRLQVRRPYKVVQFRYDALWLAQLPPSPDLRLILPRPTELLIQKNWIRFKETRIYRTSEIPFFNALLGDSITVLELIALVPTEEFGWAVAYLEDLCRQGVVEVLKNA